MVRRLETVGAVGGTLGVFGQQACHYVARRLRMPKPSGVGLHLGKTFGIGQELVHFIGERR
jgi:hypothetical protein